MKRIIPFIMMAALTTGFTWGRSSADKCDEAKQLAFGITSTTGRSSRIETEASIRQLCPDGAAGFFINGLAYEVAGNAEQALLSYRETLKLDPEFGPANGRIGLIYLAKNRDDEAAVELSKAMQRPAGPTLPQGACPDFHHEKTLCSGSVPLSGGHQELSCRRHPVHRYGPGVQ